MAEAEAWDFLGRAPEVRVAGMVDGHPVLRTMHAVAHDGALWFHASPAGETATLAGTRVVVAAETIVARIPSWMRDQVRACPATTYYASVQVEGVLAPVDAPAARAAALQALMEKMQPEGRHVPITAHDPLYRGPVAKLAICRLVPERMIGVRKLGQERTDDEIRTVVSCLWERGGDGDLAAIEMVRATHRSQPHFRRTIDGFVPRCFPSPRDIESAVALVQDAYWNAGRFSVDDLTRAHRGSPAWVGLERDGRLVATARAITDRAKRSWVYDVAVEPAFQRRGVGRALMELMLDHPAVRRTDVWLTTRDAMTFYAELGFVETSTEPASRGQWPRTHMVKLAVGRQL
jgi:GNAT superfamily N-acetyltransferase/nitroimidazol reductase NimA-like FMN-containing flavoprotein (pyridoxamine 5'-phosphate oxidase superfamily)